MKLNKRYFLKSSILPSILFFVINLFILSNAYAEELTSLNTFNSANRENLNAERLYPLSSKKKEVQFASLLKEIRCVVCQNQDLADSNALLAKDMRAKIYHFVQEGWSDQEILNYLVERYGDFILFKPPLKPLTWVLWFGPLSFLILGLIIFWRSSLRFTKRAK